MPQELSHGRTLALVLSLLTITVHTLAFCVTFGVSLQSAGCSYSLLANGFATIAGIAGMVGAMKMNPNLVSAYAIVHALFLITTTLAFLCVVGAVDSGVMTPETMFPRVRIDVVATCENMDDTFGSDKAWLLQCTQILGVVKVILEFVGVAFVGAQWWALQTVRSWVRALNEKQREDVLHLQKDVEKAVLGEERDIMW
ncbi:hypothetical protein K491DRAFT_695323 [Lophiostoma macrostomum CBS 122681]|uniref:MARVEL domain-containing protein n=1 Tax=Lophiostoma macrostomum CBS 122681 TaxID=1314788 RepID=A0A6A6T0K0_9PLEO|nr:hypothetical protein K491DRAFT_695323 [Lophiostoma macrostomum CBS 122681]